MRRDRFDIKLGSDDPGLSTGLTGWRYRASGRGPRILVTGAVHGDEVTSSAAIWHASEQLADWVTAGQVTMIPCVNQLAVRASRRQVPLENADLNRRFPGRADGLLADRLAHALVRLMAEHDALIDVHTAGWSVPFVLLDHFADARLERRVTGWAAASGLPVVGEMPAAIANLQGLDRSWSAWAVRQGKPAVTMELPGFHTIDHVGAHRGANAILNMLTALPMLSKRPPKGGPETAPLVRRALHSNLGGLFEAERKPGDKVRQGERIGWVRNFAGEPLGEIKAPEAGFLLEIQAISALHVGMRTATLAVPRRSGKGRPHSA
ncbi:MAG: succinylglutamate desuccinylase/aspartoacylase family protein [Pseudomonadota bacterium]